MRCNDSRRSTGDREGEKLFDEGILIEYGFVTASNSFAWSLYPDKSVGVRFFRRIVRGSSIDSNGFSTTVKGAVGGGKFVSSQYSGIKFARLRDIKTSSSLEKVD